tara:strand:+ start:2525 stop:3679 length:1155 start_codon:yes stop_codon:yes gene_type:complete
MTNNDTLTQQVTEMRHELALIANAPAGAPRGPSGRFYTDPAYFDYERKTVLRKNWHCVGRADELTNVGDYRAIQLLDEPLIVVRDTEKIKVLSNVCRHRGMPLVKDTGNAKRFVCSYHAWTYGTDGALLRAARMKNASFDLKSCRLPEMCSEERYGFIYVCLDSSPPDIDKVLAGLEAVIGHYQPELFRIVHTATEIWKTNWKCLVENFMEGYHLSVVHPETLHGYTPTGLSKKGPSGEGFTSYFAKYPQGIETRGQGAPGLDDDERARSSLFSVFPCQVASVAASLLVSLSIRPVKVDEIEVTWTMSTFGDELDGDTIEKRISLWEEVNREDREKLEIMQTALSSVHATGGPLAGPDYEGTVFDFLSWQARQDMAFDTAAQGA